MSPGSLRLGAATLFAFIALTLLAIFVASLFLPLAADSKTIADLLKNVLWASAIVAAGGTESALAMAAVGGKALSGLAKVSVARASKAHPKKPPKGKGRSC